MAVFFENDMKALALVDKSDDDYTTGVRATRSHFVEEPPLQGVWPFSTAKGKCHSVSESIGLSLYTPTDISVAELQRDDRPYAAWLHGALAVTAFDLTAIGEVSATRVVEVYFGVVGPGAGGKWAQNTVHKARHIPQGQGWHNQLKNEPGLMVTSVTRHVTFAVGGIDSPRIFDVVPHWGWALGNIFTHANGGVTVRLGRNLGDDLGPTDKPVTFGPPRLSQVIPSRPGSAGKRRILTGISAGYVFFRTDARAELRNVFLDGNLFRRSVHSVGRYPAVIDIEVGGVIELWSRLRLTYRQVTRSPEVRDKNALNFFGSLNLAFPAW